ncbi:MAG: HAMP domain-containing sensor histidine kinase [Acidobacteriota bacterium]
MASDNLTTLYAPAERASADTIQKQKDYFINLPFLRRFLDTIPEVVVVLNKERQIVYANKNVACLMDEDHKDALFGKRPGEALNCIHAFESQGGCGTTEFCRNCGAVNAILKSKNQEYVTEECRIINTSGEPLDLRVVASPLKLANQDFTIFYAEDISHEKRRQALERIFFHDLINTAGGILGLTDLLKDSPTEETEELCSMIQMVARDLVEEIKTQRDLKAAEDNNLTVNLTTFSTQELLQDLLNTYSNHVVAQDRALRIDAYAEEMLMTSDKVLLRRVIGNLVKNALEATESGDCVTIGVECKGEELEFWVHNPSFIPRNVQLQLFQRSFSTKGVGRGLGTYSVKLLSERYLHGNVAFETSVESGTRFKARFPVSLRE